MRNNWLFFMDLDGRSPYMFPAEPPVPQSFGGHLVSQISLFVDNSLYSSRYLYVPGSLTLQEAFNYISKFAGALLFWFGGGTNSNISSNLSGNSRASNPTSCRSPVQAKHINCSRHKHLGFSFSSGAKGKSATPLDFGKISSFTARQLLSAAEELRSFPVVSLGAALVSPFNDVSAKALGVPLENSDMLTQRCMDKSPCEVKHHGCADISFPDVNWTVHAVEPRTGIEFPTILDNILEGEKNSSLMSEL